MLASLTARLHNAGIVHQDFHPGNILVRIEADDQPTLTMIDLDALRTIFPLCVARGEAQPGPLEPLFLAPFEPVGPLPFPADVSGCPGNGPAPPQPRRFARHIEDATRAWAERLWRRWGRRCCGKNKYFQTASGHRAWAVASRDLESASVRALLPDPDAPFSWPGTILLKDSRSTTVAEVVMDVRGVPCPVIYKRFNHRSWFEPFLSYFRPTHAWQSWQAGQHLSSRAIPTPRNLAYIARMRPFGRGLFWYLPHETYLITLKVEGARHALQLHPAGAAHSGARRAADPGAAADAGPGPALAEHARAIDLEPRPEVGQPAPGRRPG